jgi:F0F1-type ATP synthase membrane subunit b/b'
MESWLDMALKYVVLPLGAFVWGMHTKISRHGTDIEVLKAKAEAQKDAHDREFKEMRRTIDAIFSKLDSIEAALRK